MALIRAPQGKHWVKGAQGKRWHSIDKEWARGGWVDCNYWIVADEARDQVEEKDICKLCAKHCKEES